MPEDKPEKFPMNGGLNEKVIPIQEISDMGTLELYSKELNRIGKEMAKETANGQVVTSELIDRICEEIYDEGLKMIFKRGIALGILIGS
jgi:hypothetical protein